METADPREADRPSCELGSPRLPAVEGGVIEAAGGGLDAVAAVDLGGEGEATVAGAHRDAVDGEGPAGHVVAAAAGEVGGGLAADRGGAEVARVEARRGEHHRVRAVRGAGVAAARPA